MLILRLLSAAGIVPRGNEVFGPLQGLKTCFPSNIHKKESG